MTETVLSVNHPYLFAKEPKEEKLRDIVRASFDEKKQVELFVRAYLEERGIFDSTHMVNMDLRLIMLNITGMDPVLDL